MRFLVAILFLTSCAAVQPVASSFPQRAALAKEIEGSSVGRGYQEMLWRQIDQEVATIMDECFEGEVGTDERSFTLVGDVLSDRTVARVAVQPRNGRTQCFSRRFSQLSFPQPPARFAAGLPIVIEMRVKE